MIGNNVITVDEMFTNLGRLKQMYEEIKMEKEKMAVDSNANCVGIPG